MERWKKRERETRDSGEGKVCPFVPDSGYRMRWEIYWLRWTIKDVGDGCTRRDRKDDTSTLSESA